MRIPNDVDPADWPSSPNPGNHQEWSDPDIVTVQNTALHPLEAKAFHSLGTMLRIIDAAGIILYKGDVRPHSDFYMVAYLLACTAIELIGRCAVAGKEPPHKSTLRHGLQYCGLNAVTVNVVKSGQPSSFTYDILALDALRNLIAHGQAAASAKDWTRGPLLLHVELLDSFPNQLIGAVDRYYRELRDPTTNSIRQNLAQAAVSPVLYSGQQGQIYDSPIQFAYHKLVNHGMDVGSLVTHKSWQLYTG